MFGVLAGVAFVACTNDNEPAGVTPAKGADEVAAAPKYMAVNFVMPGATTRAEEDGLPAESEIKDAAFLFFKNGVQVADPFVIKAGDPDAVTLDPDKKTFDPTTDAVVVLENPKDIPTSMVVLVNTGKAKSDFTGKTVDVLKGEDFMTDYSGTTNGFVMSNAVYNEGTNQVIGAPVSADNVKEKPADARLKPVDVYVDRVLAKVNVTSQVEDGAVVGTTGYGDNAKNITVKFNGWALVYENTQSYLIKNLGTDYASVLPTAFSWNDAGAHRSYWADSAPFKGKTAPAHNAITTNKLDANTVLYTQEKTNVHDWVDGRATNPTAVIVAATLSLEGAAANSDLYKLGGVVLTEGDVEITLRNSEAAKAYYKADGNPFTEYTMAIDKKAQDATLEDYQAKVYLTVADDAEVYELDENGKIATEPTAVTDVNKALKDVAKIVELWKGGATYYYVPIKQHVKSTATGDKDVYGIVRNNVYKLTVTGVSGLGTAVPDPGKPITPDKPEDSNYYIAAKIQVLKWNVVPQSVVLGAE